MTGQMLSNQPYRAFFILFGASLILYDIFVWEISFYLLSPVFWILTIGAYASIKAGLPGMFLFSLSLWRLEDRLITIAWHHSVFHHDGLLHTGVDIIMAVITLVMLAITIAFISGRINGKLANREPSGGNGYFLLPVSGLFLIYCLYNLYIPRANLWQVENVYFTVLLIEMALAAALFAFLRKKQLVPALLFLGVWIFRCTTSWWDEQPPTMLELASEYLSWALKPFHTIGAIHEMAWPFFCSAVIIALMFYLYRRKQLDYAYFALCAGAIFLIWADISTQLLVNQRYYEPGEIIEKAFMFYLAGVISSFQFMWMGMLFFLHSAVSAILPGNQQPEYFGDAID